MATAHTRLVASTAAQRLSGNPKPPSRPLVKTTARVQPVHQGKRQRKQTEAQAAVRTLVNLALQQVMRDGLLRRSSGARPRSKRTAQAGCTS